MPTAPTAPKLPVAQTSDKFALEKSDFGALTVLKLHGTLDHAFEGKKVAESMRGSKLIIDMRDVRRFASWGMSEWMDFLRINAERDLYLVECSTYAVSQVNLVTGLLGHAKLVSFYAPYRCGTCSEESETLFIVPVDRAAIRDLANSTQDCTTCGGRARLEEYSASFFETISERPAFDIDDEVLAFLRSNLKYPLTPDLTRFRAHRATTKDYTYIRMTGSLSTMPAEPLVRASEATTVVDLEGTVFDPAQTTNWRTYLQGALAKVTGMQLLGCPVGFLEHAVRTEDLRSNLKIRTMALAYDCPRCGTTTPHMIDVADNLEQLVNGVAPSIACTTCKGPLQVAMTPDTAVLLRSLPARSRDQALDRFLAKAKSEPVGKLEDCLTLRAADKAASTPGGSRTAYLALALTMLVLVGLGVVAFVLWKQRSEPAQPVATTNPNPIPTPPPKPAVDRPEWIMQDVPSTAYCHDMINRLMCVGVSPNMPTRDLAVAEANNAALEELVSTVGLKVSDPFFRDSVIANYSEIRTKALSALQNADLDRAAGAYAKAQDVVGKARKHVTELLQASGGAAVPAQRSDWYWEEYAAKGGGTEFLVFVRYDVPLDAVKALVEKYSQPVPVLGSTAVTVFPGLAWGSPDAAPGAMLSKVVNPLAEAGAKVEDVVTAVNGQPITDAAAFAHKIDEWKHAKDAGELKLTVKTGAEAPRELSVKRPRGT